MHASVLLYAVRQGGQEFGPEFAAQTQEERCDSHLKMIIQRHYSWRRLEDQGEVSVVVAVDMCSKLSTWGHLPLYHGADLRLDHHLGTQMLRGVTTCLTVVTELHQGLRRLSRRALGCELLRCGKAAS